jgi:hypothetical protein
VGTVTPGTKDTVQTIITEMHAMTDDVEAVKRLAGHGGCNGWGIGGEPYGAHCGCGLPFDDLAALATENVVPTV